MKHATNEKSVWTRCRKTVPNIYNTFTPKERTDNGASMMFAYFVGWPRVMCVTWTNKRQVQMRRVTLSMKWPITAKMISQQWWQAVVPGLRVCWGTSRVWDRRCPSRSWPGARTVCSRPSGIHKPLVRSTLPASYALEASAMQSVSCCFFPFLSVFF